MGYHGRRLRKAAWAVREQRVGRPKTYDILSNFEPRPEPGSRAVFIRSFDPLRERREKSFDNHNLGSPTS
jgi:hypothetical protein